jgi:hypothetical protein
MNRRAIPEGCTTEGTESEEKESGSDPDPEDPTPPASVSSVLSVVKSSWTSCRRACAESRTALTCQARRPDCGLPVLLFSVSTAAFALQGWYATSNR